MAGGQALIPLMKRRVISPPCVVDIGPIMDLEYVRLTEQTLCIGALARDLLLLDSPLIRDRYPILHQVAGLGHPLARTLGTIGGSLLSTESASDHASVLLALDAAVEMRNQQGSRTLPLVNLYDANGSTRIAPDELLVEVQVPPAVQNLQLVYERFARHTGETAVVGVAVAVELDAGRVSHARIGVVGASPSPFLAVATEDELVGASLTEAVIARAADAAARGARPTPDPPYPAEYKRDLVRTLTARALRKAVGESRRVDS
jgi:carbon-monoxide dehydrogenase medium subunit